MAISLGRLGGKRPLVMRAASVLRVCLKSRLSGQTAQHQPTHRNPYPRRTARRQRLVILAQPPLPTQPTKSPLHHPAPRLHRKSTLPRTTRHNLQPAAQTLLYPIRQCCAAIPAISSNQPQPREPPRQFSKRQPGAVPILDIRRMHRHRQQRSRGVHHNMTLAPHHFLARIVAARPPFRWFSPTGGP